MYSQRHKIADTENLFLFNQIKIQTENRNGKGQPVSYSAAGIIIPVRAQQKKRADNQLQLAYFIKIRKPPDYPKHTSVSQKNSYRREKIVIAEFTDKVKIHSANRNRIVVSVAASLQVKIARKALFSQQFK